MIFKVPSNSNHSMILSFYILCFRLAETCWELTAQGQMLREIGFRGIGPGWQ